jgi:hypothetical protein
MNGVLAVSAAVTPIADTIRGIRKDLSVPNNYSGMDMIDAGVVVFKRRLQQFMDILTSNGWHLAHYCNVSHPFLPSSSDSIFL